MEGKEITKLELRIDELVDAILGINYAQSFDLNVDLIQWMWIMLLHLQ